MDNATAQTAWLIEVVANSSSRERWRDLAHTIWNPDSDLGYGYTRVPVPATTIAPPIFDTFVGAEYDPDQDVPCPT